MRTSSQGIAAVIANLFYPCGVAVAADGVSFYIADRDNDRVRFVDVTTGLMSTVAGTGKFSIALRGVNTRDVVDLIVNCSNISWRQPCRCEGL